MYAFDPQFVFTALSIFFTVIGATWVVRKALSDSQTQMTKALGELKADTVKSFGELKAETNKSIGESQARTEKSIGEFKAETTKSFGEIRGDVQALGTHMNCLDKHMDKRMDSLEGEVRGINEFLRRGPVKDTENDRES